MLNPRELQRVRYWQGQMLRSQDFRDQEAIGAQRRWWHNRALHNAFGIAYGFEVELSDGWFKVGPGVAYDCFGRELVLQESVDLAIPEEQPDVTGLVLLACYQETGHYPHKDNIIALCLPEHKSALQERTDFCWKPASRVEIRDGVPLARVVRPEGSEEYGLDPAFYPPPAQPMARPHIGSGATLPGNTAWELWSEWVGTDQIPLGFEVRIDTTASGFTETPCYFAWLEGPLWQVEKPGFVLTPYPHIAEASQTEFLFRMWLPTLPIVEYIQDATVNAGFRNRFAAFARDQGLYVSWIGIQPNPTREL